jgi:hypothetical protein
MLEMKVTNITGTSDKRCKCDSWLEHWELISKEEATNCAVVQCKRAAKVGAHVRKDDKSDKD